jgi:hypothetical protein
MTINYAKEAKIHEMLADEGVKDSAHDEFIIEFRDGLYDEKSLPEHVAKKRDTAKHRFFDKDEESLHRLAFIGGNVTAQGRVLLNCNGNVEEANKIAGKYGSKLGQTKPGIDPDAGKGGDKDHSTNPWYGGAGNINPKTGLYTSAAIQKQMATVRSLGVVKATSIASAVGSKLGDIRPASRVA